MPFWYRPRTRLMEVSAEETDTVSQLTNVKVGVLLPIAREKMAWIREFLHDILDHTVLRVCE